MSRSESSTWVSPVSTAEEKELAWQEYGDAKTLLAMLVEMSATVGKFTLGRDVDVAMTRPIE